MAVGGLTILASFDGTTIGNTNIFGSDITFTDVPVGIGRRLRIQIYPEASQIWNLIINGTAYGLRNDSNIPAVWEQDFSLTNGDTLNVQSEVAVDAIVRILAY